eukprot:8672023-Pyramimonas_sp.AAC.1
MVARGPVGSEASSIGILMEAQSSAGAIAQQLGEDFVEHQDTCNESIIPRVPALYLDDGALQAQREGESESATLLNVSNMSRQNLSPPPFNVSAEMPSVSSARLVSSYH